jgi:hypothetical protein
MLGDAETRCAQCAGRELCLALSGRRDKLRVAMSPPLGGEKVIVSAAPAIGIFSANGRASVIDCASPRFCVEKRTDSFEDVVLLVAKYAADRRSLCVPPFYLHMREAKVTGDPK